MLNRLHLFTVSLICTLLLTGRMAPAQMEDQAELERKTEQADFGGVKTEPIKAAWEFSFDGGKTFAAALPATFPGDTGQVLVARATFDVEGPAAMACLWAIHDESKGGKTAPGAFALASRGDVGGVECGATPLWVNVAVALNGKTPSGPLPGMMYHALPVETAALLVKGANTLTIRGSLSALRPVRR